MEAKGTTQTISGWKDRDSYDGSGNWLFRLSVNGKFEYDQVTVTAKSANYTYQIHQSGWSLSSGNASYSGDTASAIGTFKKLLTPNITSSVTLTCSPSGVLS